MGFSFREHSVEQHRAAMQNITLNSHCIRHKFQFLLNIQKETLTGSCSFLLTMFRSYIKALIPSRNIILSNSHIFSCEEGRGWIVASQCGSGFKPARVVAVCASARLWC